MPHNRSVADISTDGALRAWQNWQKNVLLNLWLNYRYLA